MFKKIVSTSLMFALFLGGFSLSGSVAIANHIIEGSTIPGLSIAATPNSGTLSVTQTLQVNITLAGMDPTDTNLVTSPSCLINGVQVNNTFVNLTSGSNGHFRFTYTVGGGHTDRLAGQIPIDCNVRQTHTLHVSGFTGSNTVAINASGSGGGEADTTRPTIVSTTPSGDNVAVNSNIQVTFSEPMDPSTINTTSFWLQTVAGAVVIDGSVSYSGNTATFNPTNDLGPGVFYVAFVRTDLVKDVSGNAITSVPDSHPWNFTTALSATTNSGPGNNAVVVSTADPINLPIGTSLNFPTSAVPSLGTLTVGQTLEVRFTDSSATSSTTASSTSCLVNGVNVASIAGNFQRVSTTVWKVTYTVGASDTSRTEGNVPIDCTLIGNGATLQVTRFNDSSMVAINPSITATAPSLSMVSISPNSGTVPGILPGAIHSGDTTTVTFTETNLQTNLTITGSCKINGINVAGPLQNLNNGTYTLSYTVGASDGERPAGHIPYTCTLGNSAGNVTVGGAWNDGNTLSVDTNNNGSIDNGTNNLGFTISTAPSSGTLGVGGQIVISMQDPLPSPDVTIVPAGQTGTGSTTVSNGCKVNNVDVSGTYGHHGNGLYKVTYTIGAGNTNRAEGTIPFDCTLSNHTGTVHLVAFTDGNTVAVNTSVQAPTLSSIAITTPATKLSYTVGENLDIGGLVVTGTYSDSSTQVQSINTGNVAGFNSSAAATNQVLTITVGSRTTTYTVNINANTSVLAPINLLSSGNFVILSKTGITNIPTSIITGNIGTSAITGAAIGVTCGEVTGTIYSVDAAGPLPCRLTNPTLLTAAISDMETAYTNAAGRTNPTATELGAGNIGGMTLAPGLYKWSTGVTIPSNVTLSGSASDVWIFQIAGDLSIASAGNLASGIKVILSGGAQASNVFWQVGGPTGATLGTYSTFNGNILSAKQVIMQAGAVLSGRALADTQVTLENNTVSNNTSVAPTTLSSIAITTGATKLSYTVGETLNIGGLVVTGTYSDGSTQVQSISTSNVTGFNSSGAANNQVLTITVNGRTTTYTVNISAQGTSTATLNNTNSQATVTSSTQPVTIAIASGTTNPTINVSSLINAGTGTLPAITITSANANNVSVMIPASTVITSADVNWNEIISAPTVTTVTLPTVSGQTLTLSMAIELGSSGALTFDKAVRILFPGQAGKKIGYIRSGISFTEISTTCSADTQAAGNALAAGADCKMDVGADLVVWTKHFTTFATYSQTSTNNSLSGGSVSGGGGGGGGGGFNFFTPVIPAQRVIIGCDIRTTGFSIVTGQSCVGNIPNSATAPVSSLSVNNSNNGQVLGISTFKFFMKLKLGMKGADVSELQNKLMVLGFYADKIDGKFGKKTRAALIKFQITRGLKGDGVVGPITRSVLNS